MTDEKKHIITVNRKELSKKEVQERENLDSIINAHKRLTKRPIYRQKRFYFFLFLLLAITFLLYYADKEEKEIQKTEQTN